MNNLLIFATSIIGTWFAALAICEAETTHFSNPVRYDGSETLITFGDSNHREFDEVGIIGSVEFRLLKKGTLSDFGRGPQVASAPSTTYAREFSPSEGIRFIQVAFDNDLEIRFGRLINMLSAEIRARPITFPPETLTYELYAGDLLVSATTIPDRTGGKYGDFFSYGVQSNINFDRLVIRNRADERFALDNLRFAKLKFISQTPVVRRCEGQPRQTLHRQRACYSSQIKLSNVRRRCATSWRSK